MKAVTESSILALIGEETTSDGSEGTTDSELA